MNGCITKEELIEDLVKIGKDILHYDWIDIEEHEEDARIGHSYYDAIGQAVRIISGL